MFRHHPIAWLALFSFLVAGFLAMTESQTAASSEPVATVRIQNELPFEIRVRVTHDFNPSIFEDHRIGPYDSVSVFELLPGPRKVYVWRAWDMHPIVMGKRVVIPPLEPGVLYVPSARFQSL
ncbi:hypothetical protein [Tautonia marina]|uniref:hypothetical protein n=1 Tax=Tautonia marina TaxID=2653855 RepID=UPI001260C544|nr:hypothetical protein [Tautonia marina]